MPVLTPEEYAAKYGFGPDTSPKTLLGIDASKYYTPPPAGAVTMSERELDSFVSRGIYPDVRHMQEAYSARAELQTFGETLVNSIGRGLIGATGVMLENASYMTLQPLGEAFGILDPWEQNVVAQFGQNVKQFGREIAPEYKADPNSISFWDGVSDILENVIGFAVPGGLLAKGVSALAKASRVGALASYTGLLKNAARAEDVISTLSTAAISNYAEGTMMGFETYKELLEKGYSKEDAARAASNTRLLNRSLLLTDAFQVHGIYRGSKAIRNTMQNPLKWKENLKSALTTVNAENPLMQSFVEGLEEIVQGVFQREAKYDVESKYGREDEGLFEKDLYGRVQKYFTDKHLWYEGALGFIAGGAQSVVMNRIGDFMDNNKYNKLQNQITELKQSLESAKPEDKEYIENKIKDLEAEASRATKIGRYNAQQENIKSSVEYLKKRAESATEANAEIEKAFKEGRIDDATILQEMSFMTAAFSSMSEGTLDTFEKLIQEQIDETLTDEQLAEKGQDATSQQRARNDLEKLKKLEDIYLQSSAYINTAQVYFNRAFGLLLENGLDIATKVQNEVLNGPLNEKGKSEVTKGLKSKSESIALAEGSSEYTLDKHLRNELNLSDIENEAERERVKRVKEFVERTKEFKKLKDAQYSVKKLNDAIHKNNEEYKTITSYDYRLQKEKELKKYAEERKAKQEAYIQKTQNDKKQSERADETSQKPEDKATVTSKDGDPVAQAKDQARNEEAQPPGQKPDENKPSGQKPAADQPVASKKRSQRNSKPSSVNTNANNKNNSSPTVNAETNKIIQQEEENKHRQEVRQNNLEDNSFKVSVNQRKYDRVKTIDAEGNEIITLEDVDNEYQGDLETIANTLNPDLKEGSTIVFKYSPDTIILHPITRKKVLFSELTEEQISEIEDAIGYPIYAVIPIAIYTTDGKHLGFIPSALKNGKLQTNYLTLREHVDSLLEEGTEVEGEITYKYEGVHFRIVGDPISAQEAFPEDLTITVIGEDKLLGDTSVDIPSNFRIYGAAFINTPHGKPIHLKSTNISDEHVNAMADAIEVFVSIAVEGKTVDQLSEHHKEIYKLLKNNGFNLSTAKGLESFLSQYIHVYKPDRIFDLNNEDKQEGKFTSNLAKYVYQKSLNGETELWDKPLIAIYGNGIAFIKGINDTMKGKIGWSITSNNPKAVSKLPWRKALREILKESYYHVGKEHLKSKKALDVKVNSNKEIISEVKPYSNLVKSVHKVMYKSTNLGTKEDPNYVYTVNPTIKFKLKNSEEDKVDNKKKVAAAQPVVQKTPAKPVTVPTQTPVSDKKADIERRDKAFEKFNEKNIQPEVKQTADILRKILPTNIGDYIFEKLFSVGGNWSITFRKETERTNIHTGEKYIDVTEQSFPLDKEDILNKSEEELLEIIQERANKNGISGKINAKYDAKPAALENQQTKEQTVSDVFRIIDDGDIRDLTQQELDYVEQMIQTAIEHGRMSATRIIDGFLKPRGYTFKTKKSAIEYLDKRIKEGSEFKPSEVLNEKDTAVITLENERKEAIQKLMKKAIPNTIPSSVNDKLKSSGYTAEEIAQMSPAEAIQEGINIEFDDQYIDLQKNGILTINEVMSALVQFGREESPLYRKLEAKKQSIRQKTQGTDDLMAAMVVKGKAPQLFSSFKRTLIAKGFINQFNDVLDYPGLINYMNAETDKLEAEFRKLLPLPDDFKLARLVSTKGNKAIINKSVFDFFDLALGNITQPNMQMLREFPEIADSDYMKNNFREYLQRTKQYRINCR